MPAVASIPPVFSPIQKSVSFVIIVILATMTRAWHTLPRLTPRPPPTTRPTRPAHIMIVLGSGGHTAEMLSMLRDIDPKRYGYRTYIVGAGDRMSRSKAMQFETVLSDEHKYAFKGVRKDPIPGIPPPIEPVVVKEVRDETYAKVQVHPPPDPSICEDGGEFDIVEVTRARKIHQPLYTTPISCLACLKDCIEALRNSPYSTPDMIITNGPATGVIVVLASLFLRFTGYEGHGIMRTTYVESWARVSSLSLSGKILDYGLVDHFIVQWEQLQNQHREYKGVVVE